MAEIHHLHTPSTTEDQNVVGVFRAWRKNIKEELQATDDPDNSSFSHGSIDSLKYYLDCISWPGADRRFFEALPHLDPINDVNALRLVLYRLGFSSTVEKATLKNIRAEFLPCFILSKTHKLQVIRSIDEDGQCRLYDPDTDEESSVSATSVSGTAIFPEKEVDEYKARTVPSAKWTDIAVKAFSGDLKLSFFISFLANMFMLAMPVYIMNVYDKAVATRSVDILVGLSIGMLLILVTDQGLKLVKNRVHAYLGARLDEQSSEAVFRKLLFFPLHMIEDAPIGSQISRLRQMNAFRDAFTGILINTIFDLPFLVLFLLAIAIVGQALVFIPLSLMAIYAILTLWAVPRNKQLTKEVGEARTQLQNLSVEMISAHEQIRNLSCQRIWVDRYRKLSASSAVTNVKLRQFNLLCQVAAQGLVTASGVATLAVGTLMVIDGNLSAGALIASMAFAWRVLNPIRSMFMASMTIGQTTQSFEQINKLMNIKTERSYNHAPSISHEFSGNIVFDRVAFRYGARREPALRQISFNAKQGELIAICGPSGAGKSTLLKILLGFYQQQAGSVFVDGIDLRQLDLGQWRQSLGVALEASDFFHGTILQNIHLAHPTATDDDIMAMSRKFGVDQYFGDILHEDLNTRITSTGLAHWPDALKKRLALCRAFISHDPICILDNPVDNLDSTGEEALVSTLQERKGSTTIFMSTHRPSHMRLADKMLWINDGTVVAFDTPDELLPKFLEAYGLVKRAA